MCIKRRAADCTLIIRIAFFFPIYFRCNIWLIFFLFPFSCFLNLSRSIWACRLKAHIWKLFLENALANCVIIILPLLLHRRIYLDKNCTVGIRGVAQWYGVCFTCMKSWFQFPASLMTKQQENGNLAGGLAWGFSGMECVVEPSSLSGLFLFPGGWYPLGVALYVHQEASAHVSKKRLHFGLQLMPPPQSFCHIQPKLFRLVTKEI